MPDVLELTRLWMGGLSLTILAVSAAGAQRAGDARLAPVSAARATTQGADTLPAPSSRDVREIDVGRGVAGGIVGGAIGALAGYGVALLVVDSKQNSCGGDDFCGLGEGLLTFAIAESIGLAVGTHYGSRGRGSLVGESLASLGVGVAGSVLAAALSSGHALAIVPVAQIIAVLLLEHP